MIDLAFLKSNRFWGLMIVAILGVLKVENILDGAIIDIVIATVLGFIGIRTVDRFGEKLSVPETK